MRQAAFFGLLISGLLAGKVQSADNMKFYGTLIEPPPCTINDGGEVDVDFGNRVGVTKVDGNNYLQPVNYQITCKSGASSWKMTLTVIGTPTTYDAAALKTNVTDLGIRLLRDGKAFELNKPVDITLNSPPRLEAVPVKRPGSALSEGTFEATATLLAVYQ
ncbi:pilus assembly protein [Serratia marcescens]|uniref:Pilus assembly protein n=1 Tax=Serratia marcescens TaxID=615 RepID=A0A1Q4NUJ9_SERMA|nr:fimbrial protein [Serratia marcescens]OKB64580.1 pilus assembly protein [Serratia marcescens]